MSAIARRRLQQAPQGTDHPLNPIFEAKPKDFTTHKTQLFDGSLLEGSSTTALALRKDQGHFHYNGKGKSDIETGSVSDSPDQEEEVIGLQTEYVS
jgi:hypothetical protein